MPVLLNYSLMKHFPDFWNPRRTLIASVILTLKHPNSSRPLTKLTSSKEIPTEGRNATTKLEE